VYYLVIDYFLEVKMTDQRISYCGLDCFECVAYIATQEGDDKKLIGLAQEWYGVEEGPDFCACDGCKPEGRKNHHCSECRIRVCAIERDVENCAHCSEYICEKLDEFFGEVAVAKENLDKIYQSLQ
jgi:hypothetical protein